MSTTRCWMMTDFAFIYNARRRRKSSCACRISSASPWRNPINDRRLWNLEAFVESHGTRITPTYVDVKLSASTEPK